MTFCFPSGAQEASVDISTLPSPTTDFDGGVVLPRQPIPFWVKGAIAGAPVFFDTITRTCEISWGVIGKYGRNPSSLAVIAISGTGYLLYNLRFSIEGANEILDLPRQIKLFFKKNKNDIPFRKKALAIATGCLIVPAALIWMIASDGSTNFFFLNNIDNLFKMNDTPFFEYAWLPISIAITSFNVLNFLVTEGVQGVLKLIDQLGFSSQPIITPIEKPFASSTYEYSKKFISTTLGIVGGGIEASMALATMVRNFDIDSLGLRIMIGFLSIITGYVNFALRGKVIEETLDNVTSTPLKSMRKPAVLFSTLFSIGFAAIIAYSLQPLTVDMLNDGLSDLDIDNRSDSHYIGVAIIVISIINALNDLMTFYNAFQEPASKAAQKFSTFFQPARPQSTGYYSIETLDEINSAPCCTIV